MRLLLLISFISISACFYPSSVKLPSQGRQVYQNVEEYQTRDPDQLLKKLEQKAREAKKWEREFEQSQREFNRDMERLNREQERLNRETNRKLEQIQRERDRKIGQLDREANISSDQVFRDTDEFLRERRMEHQREQQRFYQWSRNFKSQFSSRARTDRELAENDLENLESLGRSIGCRQQDRQFSIDCINISLAKGHARDVIDMARHIEKIAK